MFWLVGGAALWSRNSGWWVAFWGRWQHRASVSTGLCSHSGEHRPLFSKERLDVPQMRLPVFVLLQPGLHSPPSAWGAPGGAGPPRHGPQECHAVRDTLPLPPSHLERVPRTEKDGLYGATWGLFSPRNGPSSPSSVSCLRVTGFYERDSPVNRSRVQSFSVS